MSSKFTYYSQDVEALLPNNWREAIQDVAKRRAVSRVLISSSVTSREKTDHEKVPVLVVGGQAIAEDLPWLFDLYVGKFKDIAASVMGEPVFTAQKDLRYSVNLNIQAGSQMRYECHVDSNPCEGLLYVTDHVAGAGGELVVSNNPEAKGIDQILLDCERVYPRSGDLVFFDAREYPHFVTPLKDDNDIRIVVAMNHYTIGCGEDKRPPDLNRHLFGSD